MRVFIFLLFTFGVLGAADIKWMSLENAKNIAKEQNKILMVEVSAHGCKYCIDMANTTLKNDKIVAKINKYFVPVLFFMDSDKIPQEFFSKGTPTFFFLDGKGRRLAPPIFGAWDVSDFDSFLESAIKKRGE